MKKKWYVLLVFCLPFIFAFNSGGCDQTPSSDQQTNAQQEQSASQSVQQVGFPGVTNFTEKRIVRKLYELRDQNTATFAYVMDMNGRLFHVCDSLGYGLPYGVQFSNPQKPLNGGIAETAMIDQAEPNGLFMPSTAEGTWIICAGDKKKGDFEPVYVEPRVVVSPFKLNSVGDWQAK